jgi:hypothetical protein
LSWVSPSSRIVPSPPVPFFFPLTYASSFLCAIGSCCMPCYYCLRVDQLPPAALLTKMHLLPKIYIHKPCKTTNNALIAHGRVTYSHACMSLRMWVTLHSFAKLFYCLSGLMTSCLHRAWAIMICLSQITCTNAPLACNVIISNLFLVCSHAMHVCWPSYSISIALFLTLISYLVQFQFQCFLCSHISIIILYPLARSIKAFPCSWLVYCF